MSLSKFNKNIIGSGLVPKMTATDVISLYTHLENVGIQVWLDGGWSVDAALARQTRDHGDVDIIIQQKDLPKLHSLLEPQGYKDIPQNDTRPWNFVLGDDLGHLIDVHVIVLDDEGNGIYGPIENGVMYPAASLLGSGAIDGYIVRCLTPEYMIESHIGYEIREKDRQDVTALCEKFNLQYPAEYI